MLPNAYFHILHVCVAVLHFERKRERMRSSESDAFTDAFTGTHTFACGLVVRASDT